MWARLNNFYVHRRIPQDLTGTTSTQHTTKSSTVFFVLLILFIIVELWLFLTVGVQSDTVLDPSTDDTSLLRINFNITLLDVPCEYAVIDIVDALGTRHDNVTLNINKWPVDAKGLRRNDESRNTEQPTHGNGKRVISLDGSSFDMWLSRHEYTFVNFYTPWCIWCQRLLPVWEAFAEKVEADHLPVSIVSVDCVANRELCLQHKVQAFPILKLYKHGQYQSPDYRAERSVDAFESFIHDRLSSDGQLVIKLPPKEQIAHAISLDGNSFDMWLSKHEYTFVNFYAPGEVWSTKLHPVWEAFAEKVEADHLPVSIVSVDCVANRDLCLQHKVQAFPILKLYKHGQYQSPDYRAERSVDAFESFIRDLLSKDGQQVIKLPPKKQIAHAISLDGSSFDMWLSRHEYTFVNFYTPWCIWCQRLLPVWETFAEKMEADHLPVSIVSVDCVANRDLCLQHKVKAFPTLKLYKHGQYQSPDYTSTAERSVDAFESFIRDLLSKEGQLVVKPPPQKLIVYRRKLINEKSDYPGCMMAGHLLVNRVPGNFHFEMRSKHDDINPALANLSHIVHHLSFGPVLTATDTERLSQLPVKYFDIANTHALDSGSYITEDLHQAMHHYMKVVRTTLDLGKRHSGNDDNNNNIALPAYQMMATSRVMHYEEQDVPQARFAYDISPMSVQIKTQGRPWYDFIKSFYATMLYNVDEGTSLKQSSLLRGVGKY